LSPARTEQRGNHGVRKGRCHDKEIVRRTGHSRGFIRQVLSDSARRLSVNRKFVPCWLTSAVSEGIEVDFSLPAERVVGGLSQIIEWRCKSPAIGIETALR
jgi:hypothetical protein